MPGLAIVYVHNHWTGGWPALITVFGWVSVIIGFVSIVFPMQLTGIMQTAGPALHAVLPIIGAVFLLVGGVLSFKAHGRE
ncbi:hypothetical protein [Methylocystis echinoides]|uniref:hypothetical protein n=1 Tax=Methylocystis echinoides TaxID=29468 RepID=UPI0034140767